MIDFEKSVLPSLLCDIYLFSPYAYLDFFVKSQSLFKNCKEPVKSFVGMFRKMKISLYDN